MSHGTSDLAGLRVVEIADETAEYVGLVLQGMGAEVIKIEPPGGAETRRIGPFYMDKAHEEGSLFFWHYNRGKRSVTLDLGAEPDRSVAYDLLAKADVLVQAISPSHPDQLKLTAEQISERFPRLIHAVVTPFGDHGPWANYSGCDLVHLALGGVMACCGYDPKPNGDYDLPPIAPQMWHAYHITGEQMVLGIQVALVSRLTSRSGQRVSCAIHEAVSKNTETDIMNWIMRRVEVHRMTCRHALEVTNDIWTIAHTKDGRWVITMTINEADIDRLLGFAAGWGVYTCDNLPRSTTTSNARVIPGIGAPTARTRDAAEVAQRFIRAFSQSSVPWQEAQRSGLMWAPLRRPHENLDDAHWAARRTFAAIEHPELGRTLRYPVSKWISSATEWQAGERAPLIGEHEARWQSRPSTLASSSGAPSPTRPHAELNARASSPLGLPFPLANVRVLDFGWFLASAGGTRFMSMFGAEVIKVEWHAHPDTRIGAMAPVGGREARDRATGPLPGVTDPDMGGQFHNKNTGKLGLSLNIAHPVGLEIAKELVRRVDVVTEGFSPGVLERLGLGYEVLRQLNDRIIYVRQSGFGAVGTYGRFRTVGPVAAAVSGVSEMSGFAEPYPPSGWGYSYLDWIGAYTFAQAILAGLYHRDMTGQGQSIDAAQVECGLAVTGTAILDWQVNGRAYSRTGNGSPDKAAAPHGVYPCAGKANWIAIAAFTEQQWRAVADVSGRRDLSADVRFSTLADRLRSAGDLDRAMAAWTRGWERYELMDALQSRGVPAGAVQTAEDRVDRDPQLKALRWLTEVEGKKIGRWPVYEVATKLSQTPGYAGGRFDRGAPTYGQDNEYVLGTLLGFSSAEISGLRAQGVI